MNPTLLASGPPFWTDKMTALSTLGAFIFAAAAAIVAAIVAYRQLRELNTQLDVRKRTQAEQIDAQLDDRYTAELLVVVTNDSGRPIRRVRVRLSSDADATERQPNRVFAGDLSADSPIPVLRRQSTAKFAYGGDPDSYPNPRYRVRFTDDAGLEWELDEEMHLQPLKARSVARIAIEVLLLRSAPNRDRW